MLSGNLLKPPLPPSKSRNTFNTIGEMRATKIKKETIGVYRTLTIIIRKNPTNIELFKTERLMEGLVVCE